jgi:thiol-disulfide isomerase/thioredoxin
MIWILGLLLVQALAIMVYVSVDRKRTEARQAASFQCERLTAMEGQNLLLYPPGGGTLELADLRRKAVLLHFWATWCPPCREELPALLEVGREIARHAPFVVVAVTLDEDWSEVEKFFGGTIPPEVFRDRDGEARDKYQLSTLPDTYLLGKDGTPRMQCFGARDWRSPEAREVLSRFAEASQ